MQENKKKPSETLSDGFFYPPVLLKKPPNPSAAPCPLLPRP